MFGVFFFFSFLSSDIGIWLGDNEIKPCRLFLPFAPFDGKEVSNQTDADDDDVYSFLLVLHPHPIPVCSIPPTPTAFTSSNRSVKKRIIQPQFQTLKHIEPFSFYYKLTT